MSITFPLKILLNSCDNFLIDDIFIIFFGCVVEKVFIVGVCISNFKISSNFDIIALKSQMSWFSVNFPAPTSKIRIFATMSPNISMKILLRIADNSLCDDIFITFFGCVVTKIFVVEVCISNLKYHQILL